jgi:hypothetical protein
MFVICANVEGNGQVVTNEWKTIRVDLNVNQLFKCTLKLKQITASSQITLPSSIVLPSTIELRWKQNPTRVMRFNLSYHDTFLPTRVLQLKWCEKLNMWLGDVYSQAKLVELEYRLVGAGSTVHHPDMLQFVFEANV